MGHVLTLAGPLTPTWCRRQGSRLDCFRVQGRWVQGLRSMGLRFRVNEFEVWDLGHQSTKAPKGSELRVWGAGLHRSVGPRVAHRSEFVCAPRNADLL